jgi:hypothetical protein
MSIRRGGDGVIRVDSCQHQVPGQRRLHRQPSRFGVADFANQDDVRIMPKEGPQGVGEGEPRRLIDLAL